MAEGEICFTELTNKFLSYGCNFMKRDTSSYGANFIPPKSSYACTAVLAEPVTMVFPQEYVEFTAPAIPSSGTTLGGTEIVELSGHLNRAHNVDIILRVKAYEEVGTGLEIIDTSGFLVTIPTGTTDFVVPLTLVQNFVQENNPARVIIALKSAQSCIKEECVDLFGTSQKGDPDSFTAAGYGVEVNRHPSQFATDMTTFNSSGSWSLGSHDISTSVSGDWFTCSMPFAGVEPGITINNLSVTSTERPIYWDFTGLEVNYNVYTYLPISGQIDLDDINNEEISLDIRVEGDRVDRTVGAIGIYTKTLDQDTPP